MSQQTEFLRALFAHLPPGCIEVRVIGEGRGGEVFARTWHTSADHLADALPRLRAIAERRHAGVFFGPLPRTAQGKGKAEDILPGVAVWADLDFKRFANGEDEARGLLTSLPLQPTAIVASGHGLHVYYLLREPESPDVLSALAGRLATALGGDRVHDPARILRLPGTLNLKDPANPVEARLELWEPSRLYNPSDLDEMLPPVTVPAADPSPDPSLTASNFIPGDSLPPRVTALIAKHARVRNLFEGRGKPEVDESGRALDRTSSGYDLSFVMSLAKHGVRDPLELGQSLWHRPDDAARSKGVDYIARTVQRALALIPETEDGTGGKRRAVELDFVVEGVRIYTSVPFVMELMIRGRTLILESRDLMSPRQFKARYLEKLRRLPQVPGDAQEWAEIVNGWLASAEEVQQPPESSPEEILRAAILKMVDGAAVGETLDDLDRGRVIEHQSTLVFKAIPILRQLVQEFEKLTAPQLGRELRSLGFTPRRIRIGDVALRVWGRFVGTAENLSEANPPINARGEI